ncbi:NAD(P)H nitroreductase [Thalassotalea sp. LPB0316]|uniref:NAD(P)H nitroreductase n=1 Tax=Thalassotalea sp. LPB0316 TaxID=2769490 RepID=UPI0018676BC0|nr:NAD(P)H nitroreductase [Thalassotalea sp. LPB0316]QOL24841.1 NAD(P)H nitroreductase [Thalassotalea sp. LPB0316]
MESIELLLNRQSNPALAAPAPVGEAFTNILKAGMRVPDHAGLIPWHFTVVQGEALATLANIFVDAVKVQGVTDEVKLQKTAKMPFRAPMIIVISTVYQQHDKVPLKEQLISAGCAAHAMQMAAVAQGFGAMWRTGDLAFNDDVKTALNIDTHNDIAGFLYIGTPTKQLPLKPAKSFDDHVTYL